MLARPERAELFKVGPRARHIPSGSARQSHAHKYVHGVWLHASPC